MRPNFYFITFLGKIWSGLYPREKDQHKSKPTVVCSGGVILVMLQSNTTRTKIKDKDKNSFSFFRLGTVGCVVSIHG